MSREEYLRRRAAEKQRAVLAAARAQFARHGLDGASVERIASDAEVSTATLYRYFPSKLALFEAVLRDGLIVFEETLAAGAALAPRDRIVAIAEAYATLLDDALNVGVVRAVFSAAPSSPEIAQMFYERVKFVVAGAFHEAVAAARRARNLKAGGDLMTPGSQLMGMIEHATLWRRLLSNEASNQTSAEIVAPALATFWAAHARSPKA